MMPSASALHTPVSAEPQTRAPALTPAQKILTGVLVAELGLLYWPTVAWLFDRWTMSVWHHAHGLLIPPLVAYFAYQQLKPLAGLPRSASPWGFAFLIPALALHAIDAGMHTQLLSAAALLLALPGLSLLFAGVPRTRAIAFPLAFLAFALPIPLAFTEQIHWQLRLIATAGTSAAVPWFGIPLFVEGTTLHLANGVLEVADACSGFSTLYAAIAVAALTAYSTPSPARKAAVLISAVPIAIGANLIRVIFLVLLVVWQGEDILKTWLHSASGMATFALALPLIFWIGGPARPEGGH
jgi:exosortase